MSGRRPRPASPAAMSGSSTNPNTPRSPTPRPPTPEQVEVNYVGSVGAVTKSTSSTNPSTPRASTPGPEDGAVNAGPAEGDPSPTSTASEESRHDIQPTWPKSVDVTKVNAVATWADQRLPNILLDLHWHPASHKAFFKLRAIVAMQDVSGHGGGRTSIFIFIHPERIRQLSVDTDPAEKMLVAKTMLLRFELDRPPALVLPQICVPKNRGAQQVLDACRGLVGHTSFAVQISNSRKNLSIKRLRELCAAATGAGLASLTVHSSTVSLYQGSSGQVIEGDTLAGPALDPPPANDVPPPEYSEPSWTQQPTVAVGDNHGKKRRRVDSDSPKPTESPSLKAMQALLDSSLSSLKQHFDDRLTSHKNDVAELLEKAETRILDTVRKDMHQRCNEIHDDVIQMVHEEIAEVEDNVMRNISEAPLTATLTFPHHPWY
ncbi:unnamed protein product [Discula destructiva]